MTSIEYIHNNIAPAGLISFPCAVFYFAHFTRRGSRQFRIDTRIYLQEVDAAQPDDLCVAAVVGKNPGSASTQSFDTLAPLSLAQDKLLPTVRSVFRRAHQRAGIAMPPRAFVRVLNLFYLCNPDLHAAIRDFRSAGDAPVCPSEAALPKIVWFVWGGNDPRLDPFKGRFQQLTVDFPFFVSKAMGKIEERIPRPRDFARHTQGLPLEPVEAHLANLLAGVALL